MEAVLPAVCGNSGDGTTTDGLIGEVIESVELGWWPVDRLNGEHLERILRKF